MANLNYVQLAVQAGQFMSARSGELSTQIAGGIGLAIAPQLYDYAGKAIVAGLSGDYFGCAANALPVLVGVGGVLKGVFTKEKGVTDDEIHAAVSRMSRDDLLRLLTDEAVRPAVDAASGKAASATG